MMALKRGEYKSVCNYVTASYSSPLPCEEQVLCIRATRFGSGESTHSPSGPEPAAERAGTE